MNSSIDDLCSPRSSVGYRSVLLDSCLPSRLILLFATTLIVPLMKKLRTSPLPKFTSCGR